jgi:hypothetical protein
MINESELTESELTVPFRLAPAEKDGDERLTYDVPELGQSLDARRRPGVCDARPLAMARAHADVAEPAQVPRHFRPAQKLRTPCQPASGNAHEN